MLDVLSQAYKGSTENGLHATRRSNSFTSRLSLPDWPNIHTLLSVLENAGDSEKTLPHAHDQAPCRLQRNPARCASVINIDARLELCR